MAIVNSKYEDHEISNNIFRHTDQDIIPPLDPNIPSINFEHTDQEYKNVPYQIHTNYSSVIHDYLSNWHNELEFVYTLAGSIEVFIGSDLYITHPGDIVAINRNQIHSFKGDHWRFHCIKIAAPIFQNLEMPYNVVIPQPLIRDEELTAAFVDIIEECQRERIFPQQFRILAVQKFLILFLEKHGKISFTEDKTQENTIFEVSAKVIDYLNQHLAESFSVDDIANTLGISSSHMSRCFKKATGISIVDHLNRLRCYTAKNYLMHSDKKIGEIAALCGYQNNSYFARTYKKFVGHAPNETPRLHLPK